MDEQFSLTGGARIGLANASFPFASLSVNKDVLKINATIIGKLVFQPTDILSIEPYSVFPIIGRGIKINHRVEKYNTKVIFWTFKDPAIVIDEIRKTGFLDNTGINTRLASAEITTLQEQGGFPIKKPFAIGLVVLWNVLILSDMIPFFLQTKKQHIPIGAGSRMAIGLLLITSVLTLVSAGFRKLILKEGRELNDVKKFIYFIVFISSILFISFWQV